jgi:hypothetical protein
MPVNTKAASGEALKAAFTFKLASFVNWKLEEQEDITFCFSETDRSFIDIMAQNKEKRIIQGHKVNISVVSQKDINNLDSYNGCQIVYFSEKAQRPVSGAILTTISKEMITIGTNTDFLNKGGMMALIEQKAKVNIHLSRPAYNKGAVKIQSRLLSLVRFYPN